MLAGPRDGGRSGAAADPCVHLRPPPPPKREGTSFPAPRQSLGARRGRPAEEGARRLLGAGERPPGARSGEIGGEGAIPADPWWPGPPTGGCAERVCGRQRFGKAAGVRAPSCSPPVTPPRRGRGCLPPGFVCPWNQCFFSVLFVHCPWLPPIVVPGVNFMYIYINLSVRGMLRLLCIFTRCHRMDSSEREDKISGNLSTICYLA